MGRDRVARTKEETKEALRVQTGFLAKSCKAYDEGDADEVSRIAASLRILLNSSQANSPSIIKQLGLVSSRFSNTAYQFRERNLLPYTGLVGFRSDNSGVRPLAHCINGIRQHEDRIPFAEWWSQQPVLSDTEQVRYSRMTLVGYVANEDNGTHLDPFLTRAYARLKSGESLGWMIQTTQGAAPMTGIVMATVRQIAHETLATLKRLAPDSFNYSAYAMYAAPPDYSPR
ncbi:hypothetical protein ACLKMY_21155 [Paraburkholderia mimosarum]|uniref:hypothetical protein n=1 Tax=Paraburkholderia mimosarum TaxID=312026 RepID=UPI0039C1E77D